MCAIMHAQKVGTMSTIIDCVHIKYEVTDYHNTMASKP